jgi:sRNA-binding protein
VFNMTRSARLERAAKAREIISILAEWFPQAFHLYERGRRPLKVGIHADIIAATNGAITTSELGLGLQSYTSNRLYLLESCRPGTPRVDLSGNVAGHVSISEAENASAKLQKIAQRRLARKACIKTTEPSIGVNSNNGATPEGANGTEPAIKRISLKDLRDAALARKAQSETGAGAALVG